MYSLKSLSGSELIQLASEIEKEMKRRNEEIGVGATGKFPQGKIDPDDEGELRVAITREGDNVILNFGKPVAWLALPKDQVRGLISLLMKHLTS